MNKFDEFINLLLQQSNINDENKAKLIEHLRFYDRDLNIPNVVYIHREIDIIRQKGIQDKYAIGFMNLQKFAGINQILGRQTGSLIMGRYIGKLQALLGDDGLVGRAGGDNFVIIFKKEVFEMVKTYISGTEIIYDDTSCDSIIIQANLGVYFIDGTESKDDDIVEMAQIALHCARRTPEKNCVIFDEQLKKQSRYANYIQSIFMEALDKEEFLVYYQPKVRLDNHNIEGAEALCRWEHNGLIIQPDDFIPILEQSDAICSLDLYMFEHVCRDLRNWLDKGLDVVKISVNLSRRHMGDSTVVKQFLELIDKYEVPHSLIEIELIETTTDVGFNELSNMVNELHQNGISTSIDDFGIGYSSINLIRLIDWDMIKIDKSLLPSEIDYNSQQYILFNHLMSMFKALGLNCLVEGVETQEQVNMLIENGCNLVQGFYFDEPLPEDEFEDKLKYHYIYDKSP